MTDLLPCPFCGSRDVDPEGWMSSKPDGSETGIISTGPACDECAGSTESVERWNQRVPLSIGGAQTESGCDIDSVWGTADDQGLFAQRGPEPVAWRWRNELGPEDCWTYSPRKPDAHPQYITEPLYTSSALTRSTANTVDAPAVPEQLWSASKHDEIIKRLMADIGHPNSQSIYGAFKQFANELHALTRPSPKWRHLKRGSIVTEIARGFAQVAHHPIEEMTCVVIYRHDDDGRYWVRNAVEFDDGRFEAYPVISTEGRSS